MVQTISALNELLGVLTGSNNKEHRRTLAKFHPTAQNTYYLAFAANLLASRVERSVFEGEASLLLTIRLLWRLVPTQLFDGLDPDYERLAAAALHDEFGAVPNEDLVNRVAIVFRRLRRHWTRRRTGLTSLDLSVASHYELLRAQQFACASCRFVFPQPMLDGITLSEAQDFVEDYAAHRDEITLEQYYRRPCLDHIVPQFLGGDGPENWQILCQTCNSGKGEALTWLTRRGWMPPTRLADLMALTPALYYACLAIYPKETVRAEPHKRLRIFKVNALRMLSFDNLRVEHA